MLLPCSVCGRYISEDATVCPGCGSPEAQKRKKNPGQYEAMKQRGISRLRDQKQDERYVWRILLFIPFFLVVGAIGFWILEGQLQIPPHKIPMEYFLPAAIAVSALLAYVAVP